MTDPLAGALAELQTVTQTLTSTAARMDQARAGIDEEVVGTAGAGEVRATFTGTGTLVDLHIGQQYLQRASAASVGEAVRDAIRQAQREVAARQQQIQDVLRGVGTQLNARGEA
jgi:DNA-binding protein YbaB